MKNLLDWVRTIGVSANENFNPPFNDYEDERSHIYANYDTLYFRIISADQFYGGDLSLWPQSVVEYAELEFAALACKPITDSDVAVAELRKQADPCKEASMDGMNGPSKRMPMGHGRAQDFQAIVHLVLQIIQALHHLRFV